jgi:outer membrane receptor protein involved in Fe transport
MAPKLSGSLSVDWRAAHLSAGDLHISVDGNYYGKQYFDALNTERISQSGYTVFNARLALLGGKEQRWSFALWGKNLANREYLSYGLAQRNLEDGGLGFDYTLVGEPRTFGLEATARF